MKRFTLSLFSVVCAILALAAPAERVTISHQQKDGTVLTLTLQGDEFFHYYVTPNGDKMTLGADGDYHLMTDFAQQEQAAQEFRAKINAERVARCLPPASADGVRRAPGNFLSTAKGDCHVLVVLVQFKDVEFQSDLPAEAFRAMYNDGENSLKAYFESASYGQFRPIFDVIGPVTLDNTQAHYGARNESASWKADDRIGAFTYDAMMKAIEVPITWSIYDWNADNKIENIIFITAGGNESQGGNVNSFWPHQWSMGSNGASGQYVGSTGFALSQGGKTYYVNEYCLTGELYGSSTTQLDGIGSVAHEYSHGLGLPDLYSTKESYYPSTGYYDLMDRGCYNGAYHSVPCGYSAYERSAMGWLSLEELSTATTVQNMPSLEAQNATHRAFKVINPSNSNQYYVLENRQNGKWFQYNNQNAAAHGLYVTRINYSSSVWTGNTVNASQSNQHLVLEAAGSRYPASLFTYSLGNVAESNGTVSFDFAGGSASNIIQGSDNGGDDDSDDIPDGPKQASVYFPHIAHLGKVFTAPKLNIPAGFTATLTYSSSNPEVATVDRVSGAVTINAVGTAIITVTSAETDTYVAGSASYMIKVVE